MPGDLDKLAGLRDAGAIGLKAFMSNSGIDSFPRVDAKSLREGMKRAAKLGLLVAVHAEDDALATKFTAAQVAKGKHDAEAWLASRPVEVELAAIGRAIEFAGETGCALHVVHVSSPEGLALIAEARGQRVDVTAETCSHYLLLNDKDVAKLGAPAKCAPPIRDEKRRVALWRELRAGNIRTVGSDHSPSPPDMKTSENFFEIWGGIAGVQHGFQLLLDACAGTADKDLPMLAAVLARNVARRFRLGHQKGLLAAGHDADFSLVEFGPARKIAAGELWTRHPISPYIGRKNRTRVTDTYVRAARSGPMAKFFPAYRRARFSDPNTNPEGAKDRRRRDLFSLLLSRLLCILWPILRHPCPTSLAILAPASPAGTRSSPRRITSAAWSPHRGRDNGHPDQRGHGRKVRPVARDLRRGRSRRP